MLTKRMIQRLQPTQQSMERCMIGITRKRKPYKKSDKIFRHHQGHWKSEIEINWTHYKKTVEHMEYTYSG